MDFAGGVVGNIRAFGEIRTRHLRYRIGSLVYSGIREYICTFKTNVSGQVVVFAAVFLGLWAHHMYSHYMFSSLHVLPSC